MRFSSAKRFAATLGLMAIPMFATACGGIKEKDFAKQQADTICDLIASCNCFYDPAGSKAECVETWVDFGEAMVELADLDQLTYDDKCAEEALNELESIGCDAVGWDDSCERPCKIYYGPVPSGGTCTSGGAGMDNCQQGLTCSGGICVNPCEEANWPSAGESCWHGNCDDDSYCFQDLNQTPICVAYPTTGFECTNFGACAEGNFCDTTGGGNGVCALLPTAGVPCGPLGECDDCLVCADGVCNFPPGSGQPCLNGACDAGLHCNAVDQCEADVCLAWTPSGAGGGTGGSGGTDTGADTGADTTGGGAGCQAYGDAMAACLGSDAATEANTCQTSVDAGYMLSGTCGDTYAGYFNCLATADCTALMDGTAQTDCVATWDFATACQ